MTWWRGISLTQRLTLLFGGVTAQVFAATGFYLHQALARQLEIGNDAELIGKLQQLRHLLSEVPEIASSLTKIIERFWVEWVKSVRVRRSNYLPGLELGASGICGHT